MVTISIRVFLSLIVLPIILQKWFFVFLYFMCFLLLMSFDFNVRFIELQHLHNHCLYKFHVAICDFALISVILFDFMKTISIYKNIKILSSKLGFYSHISKNTCFQKGFELIRKVIYKENCGTVTKRKFNKYKLYFWALVLALYCYIEIM